MPELIIDGQSVEVAPGATLLDAARQLGIDIPTLCYLEQCGPMTSCLVCVVKVTQNGRARIVPSCAAKAEPGMVVESETTEIRDLRRTAFELLLSDHVGDCLSPCHRICPLDLNIPRMIRQIETNDLDRAITTLRQALALPAVLGRLCSAPCQNGCRRGGSCGGGSAAIRDLERFVADACLRSPDKYLPARKPSTGKSIAIVGSGPTGLAAAYYLLRQGHACTLLDRQPRPGGSLRRVDDTSLPPAILDAELDAFKQMGAQFQVSTPVGADALSTDHLRRNYDAVLIAAGELSKTELDALGLLASPVGVRVNTATGQTEHPNVFAAGSAVKPVKQLVRAMSEGQAAAECLHQFLVGLPIRPLEKAFSSVMGRLEAPELDLFLKSASPIPRTAPAQGLGAGFTVDEARGEAARCLHCDCRAEGSCNLQHYAELYGANPNRFARQRRLFEQHRHPARVIFEPGKCILCGICIHIAQQAAEPLGLTFVGRGFNVQVAAPLDRPFSDGLQKVAAECVKHCPTGAIVFDDTFERTHS
ncbi:MAG: FAD-dependent oxidoreductase [Verrucomicrobia bacterium]|nr:FAD-dependent oxidoreductase [Verrucomicrobiota bacterium]